MKRLLMIFTLAVLTIVCARADKGGYNIKKVNYKAVVLEQDLWDVTETLVVNFSEPRHGIYRYIPTAFHYAFTKPDGSTDERTYYTHVRDIDVDGFEYSTDTDDSAARNKIIKIGSADKYVEGEQTYVIHYRLQYFDDCYAGEDFLCHTLWGTDWGTDAQSLSFSITFEKPLPADFAKQLHLYSGKRGAKGNDANVLYTFDVKTNTIKGSVTDLEAHNGITISARLPEGYWIPYSKATWPFWVAMAIFIACALVYVYHIVFVKIEKPVPTVAFYPPKGMTSAEVGKIIDGSTDNIDLASLIPYWAHRGFITITETQVRKGLLGKMGSDITLRKVMPLTPDAKKYEHKFFKALFDDKSEVTLSKLGDRHFEMESAKNALDACFVGDKKLTDITNGLISWFIMLVAAVLPMFFADSIDVFQLFLPFITVFTGIASAFIAGVLAMSEASRRLFAKLKYFSWMYVVTFVIALVGCAIAAGVFYDYPLCAPFEVVMAMIIAVNVLSLFLARTEVDTPYRVGVAGELLGLREFIETAEKDRLEMLVDENPQYFYAILPYAMVFGLTDKWSNQFANIEFEQPEWFNTYNPGIYTGAMMARAISHSVTDSIKDSIAQSSIDTTSSSSSGGYSGGGHSFSGGGGGGGGGGSW